MGPEHINRPDPLGTSPPVFDPIADSQTHSEIPETESA